KNEDETPAQKNGVISQPRQRDSYLIQATPGTTVNIVVNGTGTSGLPDPLVEVYDPEDFLVAANDNDPGRGKNSLLTVTLPDTAVPLRAPISRGTGQTFENPSTYRIVVMGIDSKTEPPTSVEGGNAYFRKVNGGNYELKVFTGSTTQKLAVSGLSPNKVIQGLTDLEIIINGNKFVKGAAINFSRTGITTKAVNFTSPNQLKATLDIASAAPTGFYDITITNPDGQSVTLTNALEIKAFLGKIVLKWDAPASGGNNPPSNLTAQYTVNENVEYVNHTKLNSEAKLSSYRVYRSNAANACTSGKVIYEVNASEQTFTDTLPCSRAFFYQVTAVYDQGESAPSNEITFVLTQLKDMLAGKIPENFELRQNYPNPFNPVTKIQYSIPKQSFVSLKVYDIIGREVAILVDENKQAGNYEIIFNAEELSSGVYFYRLDVIPEGKIETGFRSTRKFVLLR
ncbi:MAG: T9SS type A sorting domain-containing protein, partial [Bacillota bacterium]